MDHSVWGTRWGGTEPSGKNTYLAKMLSSREQLWGQPTSQVRHLSSTLAQVFLAQSTQCLAPLGLACTPSQCLTRRRHR